MEDLVITLDNKALKASINNVIKSVEEDLVDLRNKTPEIVANKLLELSKALVPIYTGTLAASGHTEAKAGYNGGTSLIFDATKGEQEKAQEEKFGTVYFAVPKNEEDKSYAEEVDYNTGFLISAVDLYTHGTPPVFRLKNAGKPVYLKIDLELKKYGGYVTRRQVRYAKKIAETIYRYNDGNEEGIEQKDIDRMKKYYKKKFGANYKGWLWLKH